MKGNRKTIWALLAACLLLGVCITALAATPPVDLTQPCTIFVAIGSGNIEEDPTLRDLVVDIYFVADAVPQGGSYVLEPVAPYEGLNFEADDAAPNWQPLAQAVAQRTFSEGAPVVTAYKSNIPMPMQQNNPVPVDKPGLYLIIAHSTSLSNYVQYNFRDTEDMVTLGKSAEYRYYFEPVLLSVPYFNDKADVPVWVYDASSHLKPQEDKIDTPDITIKKTVAGSEDHFLPGAKFALYAAVPNGSGDTREVYVEGVGLVTLYRYPVKSTYSDEEGYITTGSNGEITFQRPDVPEYTLFALEEITPPSGYKKLEELIYFYADDSIPGGSRGVLEGDKWRELGQPGILKTEYSSGGYGFYKYTIPVPDGGPYNLRAHLSANSPFQILQGQYEGGWRGETDSLFQLDGALGRSTIELHVRNDEHAEVFNVDALFEYSPMGSEDWSPLPDPVAGHYTGTADVLAKNDGDYTMTLGNEPNIVELPAAGVSAAPTLLLVGGLTLMGLLMLAAAWKRSAR